MNYPLNESIHHFSRHAGVSRGVCFHQIRPAQTFGSWNAPLTTASPIQPFVRTTINPFQIPLTFLSKFLIIIIMLFFLITKAILCDSVSDCVDFFGEETIQHINKDDSVVFDTQFSKVVPLEDGKVHNFMLTCACLHLTDCILLLIIYCRIFTQQSAFVHKRL